MLSKTGEKALMYRLVRCCGRLIKFLIALRAELWKVLACRGRDSEPPRALIKYALRGLTLSADSAGVSKRSRQLGLKNQRKFLSL